MKFLWALAKKIYLEFWLKPVTFNKKYSHGPLAPGAILPIAL